MNPLKKPEVQRWLFLGTTLLIFGWWAHSSWELSKHAALLRSYQERERLFRESLEKSFQETGTSPEEALKRMKARNAERAKEHERALRGQPQ